MTRSLAVIVDGVPMPEEEARAFWTRFSDWMEEHRGDLAGFAAREGFASVHPGVGANGPVLVVSRSAAQQAYGNARRLVPGGSEDRQKAPSGPRSPTPKPKHSRRRRGKRVG